MPHKVLHSVLNRMFIARVDSRLFVCVTETGLSQTEQHSVTMWDSHL